MKIIRFIGTMQIVLALGFFLLLPRLDQQIVDILQNFTGPAERFSELVTEHRELYSEVEQIMVSQADNLLDASRKCRTVGDAMEKIGEYFQNFEGHRFLDKLAGFGKPFTETGIDFKGGAISLQLIADKLQFYNTETSPKVVATMDNTAAALHNTAQTLNNATAAFHKNAILVATLLAVLFLMNGVALIVLARQFDAVGNGAMGVERSSR